MPTSGEAEDADAICFKSKLSRAMTQDTDRALGVLKRLHAWIGRITAWHAVFQKHAGDAERVQVFTDLRAFMLDSQDAIATTRADDDRGAIRLLGFVNGDGGIGDIGHALDAISLLEFLFGADLHAGLLRRALRPELDRDGFSSLGGKSKSDGE